MRQDMHQLLQQAAVSLCKALEHLLPPLGPSWWNTCVVNKLSFQQRQHIQQRGFTRLEQLDLSALLRVVDQNWYFLADSKKWTSGDRNFVKEMQTVRNRWAHAQVAEPPIEDIYRDLDTIHRFLSLMCPEDTLTKSIESKKKEILDLQKGARLTPHSHHPAPQEKPKTRFMPGDIVRLRVSPGKSGAVTAVTPGEREPRYDVFHDGKVITYYDSQLLPVETSEKNLP